MCPVCITNIALMAAGVTSSGGLTTFAVGKLYKKNKRNISEEAKMKLEEMEPNVEANPMNPEIVSEDEWLVARKDLLAREKEFNRQRDALSAARHERFCMRSHKRRIRDALCESVMARGQLIHEQSTCIPSISSSMLLISLR